MTTTKLAQLIGQTITLRDPRTGVAYQSIVVDAVCQYGKLRVTCGNGVWFEPAPAELEKEVRKL